MLMVTTLTRVAIGVTHKTWANVLIHCLTPLSIATRLQLPVNRKVPCRIRAANQLWAVREGAIIHVHPPTIYHQMGIRAPEFVRHLVHYHLVLTGVHSPLGIWVPL